jgi:glycopeptide antibiotics resistance protein
LNLIKGILKNILLAGICFFASLVVCYYVFDNLVSIVACSNQAFMAIRILFALIFFVLIKIIINKGLTRIEQNVVAFFYLLIVLFFTFFKTRNLTVLHGYNLNPLDILNDIHNSSGLVMTFGNICAYIPLGFYFQSIYENKTIKFLITCALIYSTSIEACQYILHLGIFDIDDIILNTLGLLIGLNLYRKIIITRKKY